MGSAALEWPLQNRPADQSRGLNALHTNAGSLGSLRPSRQRPHGPLPAPACHVPSCVSPGSCAPLPSDDGQEARAGGPVGVGAAT